MFGLSAFYLTMFISQDSYTQRTECSMQVLISNFSETSDRMLNNMTNFK